MSYNTKHDISDLDFSDLVTLALKWILFIAFVIILLTFIFDSWHGLDVFIPEFMKQNNIN